MFVFSNKFYYSDEAKKKKHKLLRRIKRGKPCFGAYLLAIPANSSNILEIISANELIQPHYKNSSVDVVGLACSKDEAYDLTLKIVEEVYEATGGFDICMYCYNRSRMNI
ncbi:MAG: hypothetical protein K6F17_00445 [Lachnospiraceae bacterium]|nr:hypothetical protein [Lachnospiraceae bacterium]